MIKKIVVIIVFAIVSLSANSQCKYYNRVNKKGERTGIWFSYWDASEKVINRKFHYKNGREWGVCKIYNRDGILVSKERHYKKRIRIKSYRENGKMQRKGWAVMEYNAIDLHFFWHGKWKFYGENVGLNGISIYENGEFKESVENRRTKRNQEKI